MKIKMHHSFKKDILFKLMIAGEDEASHYIRKVIFDGTIQLTYKQLTAINPEMVPDLANEKTMIFDTLLETDTGELIQVEMQDTTFTEDQKKRFQANGAALITHQTRKGKGYDQIKKCYQIIFVNDMDEELKKTYTFKDQFGIEEQDNLLVRVYVFLKSIEKVVERKVVDKLSELEVLIYLFNYNLTYDILKIDRKVVCYMQQKMDEYHATLKEEWNRRAIEDSRMLLEGALRRADKAEKRLEEQTLEVKGLEDSNKELEDSNKELEDSNKELRSSSEEYKLNSVNVFMEKLGVSLYEAFKLLNVPEDEQDNIAKKIGLLNH